MPRLPRTTTLIVSTILLAQTAIAGGHGSPEDQAIAARQAHMTLMGFNLGPLGAMAQERIPYDADVAAAAAANLAALSTMSQSGYWLEGTDSSLGNNRAKAEIWTDFAGVSAEAAKLAETSAALAAVAGDGLDAMRAALGPVGGTCGSCHEAYRAPRN